MSGLVQGGPQQVEGREQRASCIDPDGSWSGHPKPFKRLHERVGVPGSDQAAVDQVFWARRSTRSIGEAVGERGSVELENELEEPRIELCRHSLKVFDEGGPGQY